MKLCSKCKESGPPENFSKKRSNADGLDTWCKKCTRANTRRQRTKAEYNARQKEYNRVNVRKTLLYSARLRASEYGLPCTISESDISIPEFCPILGIKIVRGEGSVHAGSPSLDRIIPEIGYVPGNIHVISYKANTMKSDATLRELMIFAKWIFDNMAELSEIPGSEFQD